MSFRALPLIILAFILYNVVVLFGKGLPNEILGAALLPPIPMLSKATWTFTYGDFLICLTMILLFIELLKSTYNSAASLVDHALSMLVFVACLIEFLAVPQAATSVFFIITVATLIDVIAGYTIGIRTAQRDFSINQP